MSRLRKAFGAVAILTLALLAGAGAQAPPKAMLADGVLEGRVDDGVVAFLGVPFAAAPVGPLRWKPPQPEPRWTGLRKAIDFAPDCMQQPLDYIPGPGYVRPVSEDCLYLNVWRPASAGTRPLPVMVWIHGGAYTMGSGSWPAYRGGNLARQGVIAVSINYRLGRFGFFAHPALTAESPDGLLGNYGTLDQMAALRWVRKNIVAFGGDPRNVTVFGESAGAVSTNTLLASPLARGLFDKAISQSGAGQTVAVKPPGQKPLDAFHAAEARGAAWARTVGVADDDIKALRALPAAVVMGPMSPRAGASIIVDGKILPKPVDEIFLEGSQTKVPYLIGANSNEQSLLQWTPKAVEDAVTAMGPYKDEALAAYGGDKAVLWGDVDMVSPARFLARRMATSGTPVWLYHYSYVPKASRGTLPGADHSAEVSLVMHNEVVGAYFKEGAADSEMAGVISGDWVRFAKTGDPNRPGQPVWPRYTGATDQLLEFTNDGPVVRTEFGKAKMDLLDRAYYARRGVTEN